MARSGLSLPRDLDESDIAILRGMAAMYNQKPNPYLEIIDDIVMHKVIGVWAQY